MESAGNAVPSGALGLYPLSHTTKGITFSALGKATLRYAGYAHNPKEPMNDPQVDKAIRRSIKAKGIKLARAAEKRRQAELWHLARLREMGGNCPLTPEQLDGYARPQEF